MIDHIINQRERIDYMEDLEDIIKKLRLAKKLTTRELAKELGVSQAYLSMLENGKRKSPPPPDIIRLLASTLDYDYYSLMRMAGYMNNEVLQLNDLKRNRDNLLEGIKSLSDSKSSLEKLLNEQENQDNNTLDIKDKLNKVEEELEVLDGEFQETKYKIHKLEDALNSSETSTNNQQINKQQHSVCFNFPKIHLHKNELGKDVTEYVPVEEAKQRFLYLENILTMDENIYLNKKVLSKREKEKALAILKLVFEQPEQE